MNLSAPPGLGPLSSLHALQLQQYIQQQGDAHVGYREGDDPELGNWAAKQRSARRRGELEASREARLAVRGWAGERASWCGMCSMCGRVEGARTSHARRDPAESCAPDFFTQSFCNFAQA